jgi:copper chaperone CopZ
LIGKGFSPGAALIFLIAGPATNTVTLSFVYSKLGRRAFAIYLTSIAVVSILSGWLFNLIWRRLGGDVGLISPQGIPLPPYLTILAGGVLFLLIFRGFFQTRKETGGMKHQLMVPDISCKHCKMTIENRLGQLPGVAQVLVDLDHKMVGVEGEASLEAVEQGIRDAGYTPKRMGE